jgi:hypothetical protein
VDQTVGALRGVNNQGEVCWNLREGGRRKRTTRKALGRDPGAAAHEISDEEA